MSGAPAAGAATPPGEAAGAAHVEVRRGSYHDSVTLMQVSQAVGERGDVDAALVAMATELNVGLLAGMGFDAGAAAAAGPNDLLVALRARDELALEAARAAVDAALADARAGSDGTSAGAVPPRTGGTAARRAGATLALVSVPGPHAFTEAMDALRAGLHVMVFSDNVALEHEIALKAEAERRGLLVMGPDCGTAIVGGVGLGFANVTRPGPVGIVAASGTGAQQLCCLLDDADVGVSHVLGVGGRDLAAEVGGASTLTALAALDAEPATELVVVLSKPPAAAVAEQVRARAEALATPVIVAFMGRGEPDITAVAGTVAGRLGAELGTPSAWTHPARVPTGRFVRGLYAGGTLCEEAMAVVADELGPVASNVPLDPAWAVDGELRAPGHWMLDLGDDRLTRGRPHPMIDHALRLEHLSAAAADPDTAVVLLDVVLGHAAHPDPAAELAPALAVALEQAAGSGRELAAAVALCGTAGDPQDRDRQARELHAAGADVYLSNAEAARAAAACARAGGGSP
jgi:FdrA protein